MTASVTKIRGDSANAELAFGFPDIDLTGLEPMGNRLLVQLRYPRRRLASGIIIPDESLDNEKWNVQTGLVRAVGPVAFKNRTTLKPWPEGAWAAVGDYVRVPKYGVDRLDFVHPEDQGRVVVIICDDTQLFMKINADWALNIRALLPGG